MNRSRENREGITGLPPAAGKIMRLCVLRDFCSNSSSWFRILLTCLAVLTSPLALFAETPTLTVSASRDSIYLGESVLLEVKAGGDDAPTQPDLSAIKDCTIELLGSQSASHSTIIIVNGQMRREGFRGRIFTYKLTPTMAGTFIPGPVTATLGGNTLSASASPVIVTGISRQDIVSIAVTASRDTVLVDEPFEIRLAVRIRRLPGRYSDADPLFPSDPPHLEAAFLNQQNLDGLKGPDYSKLLNGILVPRNQPGFTLNNYTVQADLFDFSAMMNPQGVPARFKLERQPVEVNGKSYWEYGLTLPFSSETESSYTFGPALFKGTVPTRVEDNGQARGETVFAVGPAAIVRVIPPPEQDRPDSYINAIGSNLVAEAALDAQTCNVGDPLTLTLSLSGAVQMRNITPPKLSLQPELLDRFEIYDDTVKTLKQDQQRQYAYTLRPRQAGSFEFPSVKVSFYDVRTRRYQTVTTQPIPVKVRASAEVTASQVIGGSTNRALALHRDEETAMRPAGVRMEPASSESASLIGNPLTLTLTAAIGPVVFALTGLLILVRRHSPAFQLARRRRHAFSRAHSVLKSGPGTDRCAVLRQYLADRFNLRTEALTPAEAQALLTAQGIPAELAGRFAALMQRHFDASFDTLSLTREGPAAAPEADNEIESILAEIERHLDTPVPKPLAQGALSLLALLLATFSVHAATPAERTFIRDEAITGMMSAQTSADFLAAAAAFQKLVDLGVRNTSLFFNQGTALLLADKPADAITVLRRAERYGGSQPDIRRNLAIAQAKVEGLKTPQGLWSRTVLFWHYGLPCTDRVRVAAWAFTGLWLAAALGLLLSGGRDSAAPILPFPPAIKFLMGVSAFLLILFGSSVLVTLQEESHPQRPASLTQNYSL